MKTNMSKLKIGVLLSYICIASISAAIITPALPNIEKSFGLTHGALEWVISIFLLGYVLGQLIYGPIANRFGRLKALRSGLILNIIGVMICISASYFNNYIALLLGRLITALGSASGLTCTFILINELLPKKQAKSVMPYTVVSFSVGIGAAVLIGGVIAQYFKWQDCFWVLLIHGIVMLILTFLYTETLKTKKSLNPRIIIQGYSDALKCKELIIFSILAGIVASFAYCYSASAPLFANKSLLLSTSQYGYWNIFNIFGMIVSGFLSAHLMKRFEAKKVLLIVFILIIPALTSLILLTISNNIFGISNSLWFFLTTMLLYFFNGAIYPSATYIASNSIEDTANASSMMSFINIATAMISVIILGYLPLNAITSLTIVFTAFFVLALFLLLTTIRKSSN